MDLELNKIYCCNALDLMARMPGGFIDLTVTSPPYDNLRTYNGYEFDFEPIARELFRVTKKGGVVVWVVGDATINGSETGTSFRQALYFKEIGFNLHDTMIYQKRQMPFPMHQRYNQVHEFMFVLSKGKPEHISLMQERTKYEYKELGKQGGSTTRNADGTQTTMQYAMNKEFKNRDNVWLYGNGIGQTTCDATAFGHPAQFPEALARDHILSWSNENDLIYDPFMGSGTTAKAAHQLKRRWIGSEISSEYVELANKRLEPYLMQEQLF